eukprot:TRINITY_DN25300_c0_g1_i1.p1 TRINITY_DN25300_c0_g1~~TRINITY_DN25300_c0_g1_i1.p1  ORF type:complete len:191 (-),score=35.34 TRINITY_DN25300_c0_g1_i1:49-621(-)
MGQHACGYCDRVEAVDEMPPAAMPRVRIGKHGTKVVVPTRHRGGGGLKVSGDGTALADTVIEQDAAYWEVNVLNPKGSFRIGVCRDISGMWLDSLIGDGDSSWAFGSSVATLKEGDTVGIEFGQDDIPNLRFFLNGDHIEDATVKYVRGKIYPAVSVRDGAELILHFEPDNFVYPPLGRHTEIRLPRKML